ncbi:MAG: glucoamylase family protein [Gemmatimonadaceae bacterium]
MRRPGTLVLAALVIGGCQAGSRGATSDSAARTGAPGDSAATPTAPRDAATEAFLDTLQERTFRWFWETTNAKNGLTPDRWPTKSFSSIAAVGFALTAYPIGVERKWVTREQARDRVLTTLRFFWRAPQGPRPAGVTGYKGFFYHFIDMDTGHRFQTVELSTIDTTLLLGGILFCREYFKGADAAEAEIRALADSIYRRVDWPFTVHQPPLVSMGWEPEKGFGSYDWRGMNEGMLLYVLALGSPTHPIDPAAWREFTSTYKWGTFHGAPEHVGFGPLFGHQYSHIFIDFRGIRDEYMRGKGIDYFENARRATLAQRAYAIANPNRWRDYSGDIWGLTASDGPHDTVVTVEGRSRQFFTYAARAADFTEIRDDGTVAPTAVGGSVPFAPEITIPALKAMRDRYGEDLYTKYGFLDAFNPTFPATGITPKMGRNLPSKVWVDGDYLGIDQGPIIAMIENYRSDLIWRYMRKNPYIVAGLKRAGFAGGWLE